MPLWSDFVRSGALLGSPDCIGKEDLAMVTFSDLIQTGILIVGIIGLVLQIIEIERNHRQ